LAVTENFTIVLFVSYYTVMSQITQH